MPYILTSAMRHPAGAYQLARANWQFWKLGGTCQYNYHPFFSYFMDFLYICRGFHILYPRCTQGVPKVYPRCTQGVAKSKRLPLPWENTEYCLDRVWVERRKKSVVNN